MDKEKFDTEWIFGKKLIEKTAIESLLKCDLKSNFSDFVAIWKRNSEGEEELHLYRRK